MKYIIASFIPYAVILAQALFVAGLVVYKNSRFRTWMRQHAITIVFITSLSATLGSLFYSEFMGYTPCKLCWLQRICMYPLVLIAGFSLREHTRVVRRIMLTLAIIGLSLAGYHYVTQITDTSTFCGIGASDCSTKIVFTYGYLSIPLMAFTAFIIIIYSSLFFPIPPLRKK